MTVSIDLKPRVMVGELRAMGPGKADLLEAIAAEGSIARAAKSMGMSYRRAWQLVDAMNKSFKSPLVASAVGGKAGGGATVTPAGQEALALYRAMQKALSQAAKSYERQFRQKLKPQ
jgi:molybdate transport system regulatory protein